VLSRARIPATIQAAVPKATVFVADPYKRPNAEEQKWNRPTLVTNAEKRVGSPRCPGTEAETRAPRTSGHNGRVAPLPGPLDPTLPVLWSVVARLEAVPHLPSEQVRPVRIGAPAADRAPAPTARRRSPVPSGTQIACPTVHTRWQGHRCAGGAGYTRVGARVHEV
jgi:hypothetical protein